MRLNFQQFQAELFYKVRGKSTDLRKNGERAVSTHRVEITEIHPSHAFLAKIS